MQKLVEGKQASTEPLAKDAKASDFLGWHQRGYLPHFDGPGVTQIVTLRLVDSLPASRKGEWEALLRIENRLEHRRRLEAYLDLGWGECWLRQPVIAHLVEDALGHFDRKRYQLKAWVVMPNHLHLVVDIWETPLSKLIHSWKGFVARRANPLLKRSGAFWQREYLDTVIEDENHLRKAIRYIENNPAKAKLIMDPRQWAWSSARFRDQYGELQNPPSRSAGLQPALGTPTTQTAQNEAHLPKNRAPESRSQTSGSEQISS